MSLGPAHTALEPFQLLLVGSLEMFSKRCINVQISIGATTQAAQLVARHTNTHLAQPAVHALEQEIRPPV